MRIAFSVDEQSARKARALVDDLYRSISRLADASARAGGLVGGGGISTRPIIPGTGGTAHISTPAGKGGGGVVANVLGVGDANALRGLVQGTQQAFGTVSQNVKSFVDRAASDIQRLQRVVDQLGKSMSGMGGGGGGGFAGLTPADSPHAGLPFSVLRSDQRRGLFPGERGTPGPSPGRAAGGGGGVGGVGVLGSVGNLGSQVLSRAGVGFAGPIPGFLGGIGGAAGLVAGVGAAAIGGYGYVTEAQKDTRIAQLRREVDQPTLTQTQRAQVASPFQGIYQAAHSGNYRHALTVRDTLRQDETVRSIVLTQQQRQEIAQRVANLQGSNFGTLAQKIRSQAGQMTGDQVLNAIADMGPMGAVSGRQRGIGVNGMSLNDIVREQIQRSMSAEQAQQFEQLRGARERLMDPRTLGVADYVSGNAMSNVQMRRFGMLGPPKGQDPMEYMLRLESRLMASGYTTGELASARRGIAGSAGKGYLGTLGGIRLLSMQAGGLAGVEGIMRTAGVLGGSTGAAGRGLNMLQSSTGAGGLDPLVASELFGALGGHAAGLGVGQFGRSGAAGAGIQGAASLVYGSGQDVAAQQGNFETLQRGLPALGGLTSGSRAPLYQAASLMAAISASGGWGPLARKLPTMDPLALAGIARGGKVPAGLAALLKPGQSAAGVASNFLGSAARSNFYETLPDYDPSTAAGKLLGRVKAAGGDYREVLYQDMQGVRKRDRGKVLNRELEQMGELAPDVGGAEGLYAGLVADERFAPTLRGRGVGGAGPRGLEKEALTQQAGQRALDADALKKAIEDLTLVIRNLNPQGERARGAITHLGDTSTMGVAATEAKVFADALQEATGKLHRFGQAVVERIR